MAWATVEACERVGPAGEAGPGYWWRCEAHAFLESGEAMSFTSAPGVFTPDDLDGVVRIGALCDEDEETCVFVRRPDVLLGAADAVRRMATYAVGAGLVLAATIGLVKTVIGVSAWGRVSDRLNKRPGRG